ncbi:MAG: NADH:flavin oxidoreductase [Thermodesulfovibrio sp.]|uniref:oxidoreductase n=1 Tax=unclassified Thermodesulfovibrio TaxID=2645936 RepID=UPI00083A9CED|nr:MULTISPECIES: NADH:flavin oxidoreductase [unclassified Thermodesulfovibrio]MDI1472386.1 NADH:flavin oxidoreductase [Thermodesulfovibrio sp. 1176]MDI6714251.1 NADH:flavin oxidoreductase [Thermodesulfovibrio sp.]ODA43280.1 2,4-dienoyl-CoA reductase [NADPH] [Thermodesulfovibrio sp. N1]
MKLFTPFEIKTIKMPNRIVRSATYEKMADEDGFVTDKLINLYINLVKGGVGLIITGNALVHLSGRSAPKMLCIHNDFYIEGLKKLTSAVHEAGGRIVIQLNHGGRQCAPLFLGGDKPVAPSEVYEPIYKVKPRELTQEEIWELIESFGKSARRAKEAGFDGIQIHGAHGYLVNQFLSPYTNKRNDYWGGDEERRFHFLEEVYNSIRDNVGYDFPVMIKLNACDFVEGGVTLEESLRIAKRLENLGIDAIEVSGGIVESKPEKRPVRMKIDSPEKEAYFREFSREFKKNLKVPIMLVGGIRSRSVAEDILQKNDADLISLSRPLIIEPDLPKKWMKGKELSDCISCNGCMRFMKLEYVKCTQLEKKK